MYAPGTRRKTDESAAAERIFRLPAWRRGRWRVRYQPVGSLRSSVMVRSSTAM
jgi:hypothetical protein